MKKLTIVIIISIIGQYSIAQNNRLQEHNSIGWLATTITHSLSKKISLHTEYQWRRANFLKHWQQSLLRPGITFKVNTQVSFQVGYAWAQTFPYGTYNLASIPKDFPEHRIYEQVVLSSGVGKTTLTNRVRLEQRWIGRFTSMDSQDPFFVFMNRLRYMPRMDFPLNKKWYLAAYDEIFMGFGKNVGENIFDQNRVGAIVGFSGGNRFKIEGGFINQTVHLGREIENKNVYQYNNGVIISSFFNF